MSVRSMSLNQNALYSMLALRAAIREEAYEVCEDLWKTTIRLGAPKAALRVMINHPELHVENLADDFSTCRL